MLEHCHCQNIHSQNKLNFGEKSCHKASISLSQESSYWRWSISGIPLFTRVVNTEGAEFCVSRQQNRVATNMIWNQRRYATFTLSAPHSVTPHSGHSGREVAKLQLHRTGGHQCCGKQCNTCFADISCQKHPTSGETLDWPWQWHWMALKMTKCEYYTWHIIARLTEKNTENIMNQGVKNLSISF